MDLMWNIIIAIVISFALFAAIAIITGDIQHALMGSGGVHYG